MDDAAPPGFAYVDGRIGPLSDARVPILDRGYLLGDGVFETMRAHRGRIWMMDRHQRRLEAGLELLGIARGIAQDAMGMAVELVAHASPRLGGDLHLRAQVTTATGGDFTGRPGRYDVTAFVRPFRSWPRAYYAEGMRIIISDHKKDTRNPLATVKTLSFVRHVQARREAIARGANDALLLNSDGRVCEATTSNAFALEGQTLRAPGPEEGAVAGVTRSVVLEIAKELGLVVETQLTVEDLARTDELFLTNTVAGLVPVAAVDEVETRIQAPAGPVTRQISTLFQQRLDAL